MSFLKILTDHIWKRAILVFLFSNAFLAVIQFSFSGLLDTDPYYHLRHAMLYRDGLSATTFPWVQLTPYAKNYSDLWYGFHQILRLLPPINLILEGKLFVIAIGALVLTMFYFLLTRLSIPKPFLWMVTLIGLSPFFLSRLLSLRPHLFDILFLLVALLFLFERRRTALLILMAIFVWFHELSPLLLALIFLWSATESLLQKRLEWKMPLAASVGFVIGLTLHPGQLMYVYSMYLTLIKIPLFAHVGYIPNFGTEVEVNFFRIGDSFLFWLSNFGLLLIAFLFAITAMLKKIHLPSTQHFCLFVITLFWFLLSIVTARGMEWFVPLCILFIAFTVKECFPEPFKQMAHQPKMLLVIFFLAVSAMIQMHEVQDPHAFERVQNYVHAATWLKQNTPPKTLVINQWDVFPYLFFENQSNWYISAYDPIFLYEYDPKLSWLWYHLWAEGKNCDVRSCKEKNKTTEFDVGDVFLDRFHASYVVVDSIRDAKKFLDLLSASKRLTPVFTDGSVIVYGPKL